MEFDLTRVARNMTRNLFGTDIVANNLANINTTGFKRDATFSDWFIESLNDVGAQRYTDFAQGELGQTDNPLDLGLASQGFFVVETPSGPAFTRNGHFTVNEQGFIQTAQGYLLQGERGPISIRSANGTAGDVQITRIGEVYLDLGQADRAVESFRKARGLCRPGTPDWCRATLALAEGLAADRHAGDASDILRVAEALHPDFGDPELRSRLKALRRRLQSRTPR